MSKFKDSMIALTFVVLMAVGIVCPPLAEALDRGDLESVKVSLTTERGDIQGVLQLLTMQNDLNLSISETVTGSITIALNDVPLTAALDVVTSAAGADWYLVGTIVVVKPTSVVHLQAMVSELIYLNYLTAEEAKKIVEPVMLTGSLIEALSSDVSGEGGWDEMLRVTALPSGLDQVRQLLSELDRVRPMVEIEAKIIDINSSDQQTLGIDWPTSVGGSLGGVVDPTASEGETPGLGIYPLSGPKWIWGKLTVQEVSLLLDMLDQNGNSRLLSNPRVTTISNREAHIDVTTTVPIQTLNRFSEGGSVQDIVTFEDLDVGIVLEVTPRVTSDSTVILDISSVVEEITSWVGPNADRPVTSKREVKTSVIVRNGESLAIGGLMKEAEHKTVKKLPLLGSIPILGYLFTHHKTEIEKRDLLIIITPTIVAMY